MHACRPDRLPESFYPRQRGLGDLGLLLMALILLGLGGWLTWNFGCQKEDLFQFPKNIVLDSKAQEIIRQSKIQQELISDRREVYSFHKVQRAFDGKAPVWRSAEIPHRKFEHLIEQSTPELLRQNFQRWLNFTMMLSERYQVDPIWVMAVMWTESHFRPDALSPKMAFGPMQIMPDTATYLAQQLGRRMNYLIPKDNIEMGVFYLRWLLERFGNNYVYATVAYNMGPYWVQKRLRDGGPVGVDNNYLNKVRDFYAHLSARYTGLFTQRKMPYLDTLVYLDRNRSSYLTYFWHDLRPWLNQQRPWDQILLALNEFQGQSRGQL